MTEVSRNHIFHRDDGSEFKVSQRKIFLCDLWNSTTKDGNNKFKNVAVHVYHFL